LPPSSPRPPTLRDAQRSEADATQRPRSRRRRLLPLALGLVVVVVAFAVVLPQIADYGRVWGVLQALSPRDLALLSGVTVLNILPSAPPWMAALPGLSFGRAIVQAQASTALANVAPGGDAAGIAVAYTMLRGWGFAAGSVALAMVVASLWNM